MALLAALAIAYLPMLKNNYSTVDHLPVPQGRRRSTSACSTSRSSWSCWSAASNAVNLTDGLDGLAIGSTLDRRGDVHGAHVRRRPRADRGLPAHRLGAADGRAGGLLRSDGRRVARLPLVQRASRRDLHGRRRLAGSRRRDRLPGGDDQAGDRCSSSSAACSCSRRCR